MFSAGMTFWYALVYQQCSYQSAYLLCFCTFHTSLHCSNVMTSVQSLVGLECILHIKLRFRHHSFCHSLSLMPAFCCQ